MPRRVGPEPAVYQLRLTLDDVEPEIWRRVLVPADLTLDGLNNVVQAAFGWDNSHLHEFKRGKQRWGSPDADDPLMGMPFGLSAAPGPATFDPATRSLVYPTPSGVPLEVSFGVTPAPELPESWPDLSSPEARAEIAEAVGEENADAVQQMISENPQLLQLALDALAQPGSVADLIFGADSGPAEQDEALAVLRDVLPRAKMKLQYTYDFGDNWQHTILVEQRLQADPALRYPVCIEGARAAPPEDVGGVWGYAHFLEALSDRNHPDHDDIREWNGGRKFDTEKFSAEAVNRRMAYMRDWRAAKDGSGRLEERP